jgi:hypothetical protein
MRARTAWICVGALSLLWLVPATFVAVYDPGDPAGPAARERPGPIERTLTPGGPPFFLLAHGYTKGWTTETWEGDEATADKTRSTYFVERGPLDRTARTFRLTVWSERNHARDLEAVRLFVTSDSGDPETWTQVAESRVEQPGSDEVGLMVQAVVPASSTAYRLEEVRGGVAGPWIAQSMLTAPTLAGRVYDAIAWRAPFRWVPDLR